MLIVYQTQCCSKRSYRLLLLLSFHKLGLLSRATDVRTPIFHSGHLHVELLLFVVPLFGCNKYLTCLRSAQYQGS